ncbi:polysaccharide pyruvyl transferase family protein [Ectothiorhodospira lacustris]|uniref:polysaccharide pyruvyl transferase family protein n=1 Tax=Ectothiorhodospira lacustris TaxID=2899127 RepID=UPI001EE903E7|nr:polysaccharide pyruvyl transferase family protein [Ectothiorhodospira lacustris]MCG5500807.1 polysaccharide pyruvyl transferase family protein [Ectothiorhodospira lacustris]
MANDSTPFIIWTLRRTGGTNLTARLVELAGLKSAPHEPFNAGRVYGHITQAWQESEDADALQRAVEDVVTKGDVIKHCVETVPWAVTHALIKATQAAGYRHLFLYRRNALDRLLSLHFAKNSGIWGPDMKEMKVLEIKNENLNPPESISPLPVEKLLAHERHCTELLEKTLHQLKSLGAKPVALAYEEVYRASSMQDAQSALGRVLAALEISMAEEDLPAWTQAIVGKGDQGTRNKYREIPGYEELAKRCADLMPFSPLTAKLKWRLSPACPSWVKQAFIDVLPSEVIAGEKFVIGGVVVLGADAAEGGGLSLSGKGVNSELEWGVRSPRMATEYPDSKNGGHARWKGECTLDFDHDTAILSITPPGQSPVALLEVTLDTDNHQGHDSASLADGWRPGFSASSRKVRNRSEGHFKLGQIVIESMKKPIAFIGNAERQTPRTPDNSGNIIHGFAARSIFNSFKNVKSSIDPENIEKIRSNHKVLGFVAATMLHANKTPSYIDGHQKAADFIEKLDLPVCTFGFGCQAPLGQSIKDSIVDQRSIRLLKVIAERSTTVGVRGEFTADLCAKYGVKNVRVVGCQSVYVATTTNWSSRSKLLSLSDPNNIRVVANYSLSDHPNLIGLPMKLGSDFIGQGNPTEEAISLGEIDKKDFISSGSFYLYPGIRKAFASGLIDQNEFFDHCREHFFKFYDVPSWLAHIRKKYDFSFGTRFHGNVVALWSGIPALFIVHDMRTLELCEHFKLPYLMHTQVKSSMELRDLVEACDYSDFFKKFQMNFSEFVTYLSENDLLQHSRFLNSCIFPDLSSS